MDPIAKTSLLTAAMRALESKRSEKEGRLFVDPFAEKLAGAEGLVLLEKGIKTSGDQPAIAVRTSFMDKRITNAIQQGIKQIVIVAAGMDTRAFRMSFPKGVKIFELDRQEVFAYKFDKLSGVKPNCEHSTIAVDLREDWAGKLLQSGFKKDAKTLWLVEGLLMYLEENQVRTLLNRINSLAKSKDVLLFDVLAQSLLDSPYMINQLKFLEDIGAPWKFGIKEEPEVFMKSFGWDATALQPGETAPDRWPFPVAPRSVPNIPRSYFVEAVKN